MKLSTKILMGGMALLMASTMFIGCPEVAGETGSIGEDLELTNNTTDGYKRGYKSLKTKHTSASALITLGAMNGKYKNGDGIIGFIYHIQDATDSNGKPTNAKNFGLVGLGRYPNGQLFAYSSFFKKVAVDDVNINKANNFTDLNGKVIGAGSEATEYDGKITPYTKYTSDITKPVTYRVDVVAGGPDTDGDGKVEDGEGDGSYKITISTVKDDNSANEKIAEYLIPATVTDDTKATQYDLGIYTNAYPGQTLRGRLELVDIVNEAEVVE
ncbi:hypothetical protein [Treponema sp.]|uniref:hypothetical protein n=1 Tax=Treponema sp. TaxID=166 RepID=UPI003FD6E13B